MYSNEDVTTRLQFSVFHMPTILGNGTAHHTCSRCLEIEGILATVWFPGTKQLVIVATANGDNHLTDGAVPALDTTFHKEAFVTVLLGSNPFAPTTVQISQQSVKKQ